MHPIFKSRQIIKQKYNSEDVISLLDIDLEKLPENIQKAIKLYWSKQPTDKASVYVYEKYRDVIPEYQAKAKEAATPENINDPNVLKQLGEIDASSIPAAVKE